MKMQKKLRLKPFVIPTVYTIFVALLIISVFLTSKTLSKKDPSDEMHYVSESILDQYVPVMSEETVIKRPYNNEKVTVAKGFYDYQAGEDRQKDAIIYHENTYMQNSGVDYKEENTFDAVAILDGEVLEVKEEELLGKTVSIRHDNDMISIYQSLSDVTVQKGDKVTQGQVIGKSGTSELNKEIGNHLHFELFVKGQVVDPESYFDKKISDL